MGKRRRKDGAHDIGDSMPGTVGDSQGSIHDRREGPTFDPEEDVIVPKPSKKQKKDQNQKNDRSEQSEDTEESEGMTTRMKYAKKYGDSWPESRQRRFLREHDVSAKEMGWKITE
ncbi:hypothetical protein [Halovivax cerinus]|uniref:Uncharacterized protein n=1 Tax=Halovivax cerinus TaxID=1487865 RepID=A0ABD5NQB8_9EURY|nr:hypothetical protein [Halovivax cerinus]